MWQICLFCMKGAESSPCTDSKGASNVVRVPTCACGGWRFALVHLRTLVQVNTVFLALLRTCSLYYFVILFDMFLPLRLMCLTHFWHVATFFGHAHDDVGLCLDVLWLFCDVCFANFGDLLQNHALGCHRMWVAETLTIPCDLATCSSSVVSLCQTSEVVS